MISFNHINVIKGFVLIILMLSVTGCSSWQPSKFTFMETHTDGTVIHIQGWGKDAIAAIEALGNRLDQRDNPAIEPDLVNVVPLPDTEEFDEVLRP